MSTNVHARDEGLLSPTPVLVDPYGPHATALEQRPTTSDAGEGAVSIPSLVS